MAERMGVWLNPFRRKMPRCVPSEKAWKQVSSSDKHKSVLMNTARNPWQKLLQEHIQNKECPPRPEGFKTREEIMELSGKKSSSIDRILREMVEKKKLEVRKIKIVLSNKRGDRFFRWIKAYKIVSPK